MTIITYEDGSSYNGDLLDGLYHGEGTFTWANGSSYTGEWVNGKVTGGLIAGEIPYSVGTATVEKLKTGINTIDALLFDTPEAWATNKTYDNGTSTGVVRQT